MQVPLPQLSSDEKLLAAVLGPVEVSTDALHGRGVDKANVRGIPQGVETFEHLGHLDFITLVQGSLVDFCRPHELGPDDKIRTAVGHLRVWCSTGACSAGGDQPKQKQDARGQGREGSHGGFCWSQESGQGVSFGPSTADPPPHPLPGQPERGLRGWFGLGEFVDFKGVGDLGSPEGFKGLGEFKELCVEFG